MDSDVVVRAHDDFCLWSYIDPNPSPHDSSFDFYSKKR